MSSRRKLSVTSLSDVTRHRHNVYSTDLGQLMDKYSMS
jgi:hypothetical protein